MKHSPGKWFAIDAIEHRREYGNLHLRSAVLMPPIEPDDEPELIAYIDYPGDLSLFLAAPQMLALLKKQAEKCRCRGTGVYQTDCTLCDDSTYEHYCNDRELQCQSVDCLELREFIASIESGAK